MQSMSNVKLGVLAAALVASFAAMAEPAIIYDLGGKFDKSFNEAAYKGMEQWKKESGKKYLEFEVTNESQREQSVRRMAESSRLLISLRSSAFSKTKGAVGMPFQWA